MPTREELEIRKLELEAKHLETPTFKTSTFWISVASALVAVVGVFGQNYLSKIEAAQAKLDKTEAEHLRDKAKVDKTEAEHLRDKARLETDLLTKQRDSLTKEQDSLKSSNSQLIAVNQCLEEERVNRETQFNGLIKATNLMPVTAQSPELRAARMMASNSLFTVQLYSLGLPAEKLAAASALLKKDGYSVVAAEALTSKPPWLSLESTVLFYSPETQPLAKTLAEQLGREIGIKFLVARGAGLSVPKGQEKANIRVHLVRH